MPNKFRIESPKLQAELKNSNWQDIYSEEEPCLLGSMITDTSIENEKIERLILSRVAFKDVKILYSSFDMADMTDVIFENCDLSNTSFAESIIHRVSFINCKLMGLDLSRTNLKNVSFQNCVLNLGLFVEAKLSQVIFDHSLLKSANYYNCKLIKVNFNECDIDNIDFSQTVLNGIDISTCSFERINVVLHNLRGCIVSPEQAIKCAPLLGLVVKE